MGATLGSAYGIIAVDMGGFAKAIERVKPRTPTPRTADGFAVDPYSERLEELFVERCVRLHRIRRAEARIVLYVMRGYTNQIEVARLTGYTIATIKNQLYTARKRIGVSCITSLVAALWPDYIYALEEARTESLW